MTEDLCDPLPDIEALPVPLTIYDPRGRILFTNSCGARLLGRPAPECRGRTDEQLLPGRELTAYLSALRRCVESAAPLRVDLCAPDRLGPGAWTLHLFPVVPETGGLRAVFTLAHPVGESGAGYEQLLQMHATLEQRLAQLTATLKDRNRRLRHVAAELSAAEQRERTRIAITLHDHLQQLLVAADLAVARLMHPARSGELGPALRQIDGLIRQAIDASRSLTVELDPPVLRDAGLAAAIDWLARRYRREHRLEVELALDPAAQPGDEHVTSLLFQSVRELLFNVVKHAGVLRARVALRREGAQLELRVEDAGKGCDAQKAMALTDNTGFGLLHIQQRITMLGGAFEIDTAPGRGCRVTLSVPTDLNAEVEPAAPTPPREEPAREPGRRIRVLLADDHEMMREGIAGLLREESDIELVAEAADGEVAVELARQLHPDVVIMDVSMPRMDGIQATRAIRSNCPDARVIGLSMYDRGDVAEAMRRAGAADFVVKDRPIEIVVNAIRSAAVPAARSDRDA